MSKKENILKAGAALFAEKGYTDASMIELARMTGVAQGTIFYHFKSKEGLFLAVLKDFKEIITQRFEDHIQEKSYASGMEMLEDALAFYLYLADSQKEGFILLHRHDVYELAKTNHVCGGLLEEIYSCLFDIFEQAIHMGQRDGSIREMAARKGAMIIWTLVDGLVRFDTYGLYSAGSLFGDMLESCRRIFQKPTEQT